MPVVNLIRLIRQRRKKSEAPSSVGCTRLYLWNDGSAYCAKGIEKICIDNGFRYKEEISDGSDQHRDAENL